MTSTNERVIGNAILLDGWLLHSHPTCPIDGRLVWSAEIDAEQRRTKQYVERLDCTLTTADLCSVQFCAAARDSACTKAFSSSIFELVITLSEYGSISDSLSVTPTECAKQQRFQPTLSTSAYACSTACTDLNRQSWIAIDARNQRSKFRNSIYLTD